MTAEQEPRYLTGIYLDLVGRSLVLKAPQDMICLRVTRQGIAYRLLEPGDTDALNPSDAEVDGKPGSEPEPESIADQSSETIAAGKNPTSVIPGRLQGRAVEGRPDGRGRPTAWARFLGHVEGQEGAMLLSATFHGRTRDIALGLPEDAPITAQGYLRLLSNAEGESRRLSTLSVIHLLQYPGKPERTGSK